MQVHDLLDTEPLHSVQRGNRSARQKECCCTPLVVIDNWNVDAGLEPKVKNMTTYEYTVANTSSWNCAAQIVNRTAELQLASEAGRNITFDT